MRLWQLLEDATFSRDQVNRIVDMLANGAGPWNFRATSNFKTGFKKHKKDPRVMQAFEDLLRYISEQQRIPKMTDYPPHLNMHIIVKTSTPEYQRATWGHLKGQTVGVIFRIDEMGEVKFLNMGTHQECGVSR